jgi:hypothetical protein
VLVEQWQQVTMAAASLRHGDALLSHISDMCADKDAGAASGNARAVEAHLQQLEQVAVSPSAHQCLWKQLVLEKQVCCLFRQK